MRNILEYSNEDGRILGDSWRFLGILWDSLEILAKDQGERKCGGGGERPILLPPPPPHCVKDTDRLLHFAIHFHFQQQQIRFNINPDFITIQSNPTKIKSDFKKQI